ncbi:MAG: serine/threonine protein kinase [Planctomycetales bacterium]|nr:serine/threonine protein kinase [Planctomycetales bacterium]
MNLLSFFKRPRRRDLTPAAQGAHMTWASRTFSTSISRTREFLSRRLWAWPIIAFTLLLALGWLVHGAIERTMNENLRTQLQTLLDVEVAMLRNWMHSQERNLESMAGDATLRRLAAELLDASRHEGDETRAAAENAAEAIADELGPAMHTHSYDTYFIANRDLKVIAATYPEAIGMTAPAERRSDFARALDGLASVTAPFASQLPLVDEDGVRRTGVPVMYAVAPIRDENLQVVAVLGMQIRPQDEFTRILQLGRLGETGETYAFDADGLLLSGSRFDEELILLGLLEDHPNSHSILKLRVRDPGGNMVAGYRPKVRRSEMEPTRMVESAAAGETAVDVAGYADYRGVQVVGAWTWLKDYGMGVAVEVDYAEAFRPLMILKRTFWGLLILLALSSIAIFVFTVMVARLQRQAREAAIEAKQLGQYKLEEKLGAGAMGVVYKGRHAMLARPTAIKMLNADDLTDTAIARFEREVQITSNLNHPNTVAIYDYGRTPEGVFYYAMEFLDGIDLQELVEKYGPQSAGRVIYILRQICGSLYEAHSNGLVHRDVKPANIMLNRRGGEGDVVKVLDFGLVKARDDQHPGAGGMAGTPLYMSPEAIQAPNSVDACSDIYAVGAVGYFLLTGQPVFEAHSFADLCQMHASEPPKPPSLRLGRQVPEDLENAILACLEKSRSKRPQTARELAQRLSRCADANAWTLDDADAWWGRHERGQSAPAAAKPLSSSNPYAATIDH